MRHYTYHFVLGIIVACLFRQAALGFERTLQLPADRAAVYQVLLGNLKELDSYCSSVYYYDKTPQRVSAALIAADRAFLNMNIQIASQGTGTLLTIKTDKEHTGITGLLDNIANKTRAVFVKEDSIQPAQPESQAPQAPVEQYRATQEPVPTAAEPASAPVEQAYAETELPKPAEQVTAPEVINRAETAPPDAQQDREVSPADAGKHIPQTVAPVKQQKPVSLFSQGHDAYIRNNYSEAYTAFGKQYRSNKADIKANIWYIKTIMKCIPLSTTKKELSAYYSELDSLFAALKKQTMTAEELSDVKNLKVAAKTLKKQRRSYLKKLKS